MVNAIIEIVLQPLMDGAVNSWHWVLSSSYRRKVSKSLAQARKFEIVSVYLGGAVLFLFGLFVVAVFGIWLWMSPGAQIIKHALLKLA